MLMVEKRKLPFNEHADEILLDLLGMSEGEVGRFIDGLPAPSYFRCPASRLDSPYASRQRLGETPRAPASCIPDNGICKRFHKTVLDEF
jgi:hypothetical protein